MKQVIIIHGGTTFSTYDKYFEYLSTKEVKIDRLISAPSWKDSLQEKLGDEYLVLKPSMPNSTNAQYEEWKLWFERIAEITTNDCILVGHSLGGIFLAKYLSENRFPKTIHATILIAAPYDDESDEDLASFKITNISTLFSEQSKEIILFNGVDDPVVPVSEAEKYRLVIPNARISLLTAPDHFVRANFPELVDTIHNLK